MCSTSKWGGKHPFAGQNMQHTHTSIFFVKMGVREGAFYYTIQEKQAIISLQEMAEFLKLICLFCGYICLKI